jgi:hypothetical protein
VVEHETFNLGVVGSSPTGLTNLTSLNITIIWSAAAMLHAVVAWHNRTLTGRSGKGRHSPPLGVVRRATEAARLPGRANADACPHIPVAAIAPFRFTRGHGRDLNPTPLHPKVSKAGPSTVPPGVQRDDRFRNFGCALQVLTVKRWPGVDY